MTIRIRSRVWKIFLWFWATVIVTGISLVLAILSGNGPSQSHTALIETARQSGNMAVEEAELHGPSAASAYLARIGDHTRLQACLFDASGDVIVGSDCAPFLEMTARLTTTHTSEVNWHHGNTRIVVRLSGKSGTTYVYASSVPSGPHISRLAIARQWCVALLVSGFISFSLASGERSSCETSEMSCCCLEISPYGTGSWSPEKRR